MAEFSPENARSLWARFGGTLGDWLGHRSIPPMAAALAYRTVFSIIPICIIAVVVLQRFVNKQSVVDDLFARAMTWLGVAEIGLDGSQRGELFLRIQSLVGSLDKLSFTGIGIVSGLTLIYAALSLLIELENAFNRLYGAARGRSLVRRIMQYWLLVSLGPVVLAGSFLIADRVTGFTADVAGNALMGVLGFMTSVAISTAALWVLYVTIPNTKVKPLAAVQGALVSAVVLEAAKWGFQFYLERAALKTLYGSLALIPIFLLWVYVTWLIVLTGLRISYLIQQGKRVTLLHLSGAFRGNGALVDPAYALPLSVEAARAFAKGEQFTAEELAERVAIPEAAARALVHRLSADGVLLPVEKGGGEDDRYTLARPAERIELQRVLRAGFEASGTLVPPSVEAMRNAQLQAASGQSLADIAGLTPASDSSETVSPETVTAEAGTGV